ncbi:hypothetical protein GCM10019017_58370 [Streptomyces showdoensis]
MFQAELVHPSGEARVGEAGLGDERGELAVRDALRGSFRHQLCGLLPSGPGGSPPVRTLMALMERREFSGRLRPNRHLRPTFIRSCEERGDFFTPVPEAQASGAARTCPRAPAGRLFGVPPYSGMGAYDAWCRAGSRPGTIPGTRPSASRRRHGRE